MGRAPGCGGGGSEGSVVVVARFEAGVVRVGGGFVVWGVAPSGLEASVGFMGESLWIGIGGIVYSLCEALRLGGY